MRMGGELFKWDARKSLWS